ncbi:MAG: hypothetical protein WHX52_08500 [Anaerolineae bacterium]
MLKGHQDMLWLAGQVLLSRNFVKEAEERGLDAVFAACPYGDLTEQEKAAFGSAFENKELRKVVEQWWKVYDEEREKGAVVKAGMFWE